MTLDEVFESEVMISRKEAHYEVVDQHGLRWEDFLNDMGDHEEYSGADVLIWLGY